MYCNAMTDISKDEVNMDEYDRYSGIATDGKTRGIFGTIYDKEGKYDFVCMYGYKPSIQLVIRIRIRIRIRLAFFWMYVYLLDVTNN